MKSNSFTHYFWRFSLLIILLALASLLKINSCQNKEQILSPNTFRLKNGTVQEGNMVTFWGHETFTRGTGEPVIVKRKIGSADLQHFEPEFTLHLQNGDGTKNLVSSAIVKVDGKQIFGPSDFSQTVKSLSKELTGLTENSEIEIELRGTTGSYIDVWIEGVLRPGRAFVGIDGGIVESEDGNIKIAIPPNSIEKTIIISITEIIDMLPSNIVGEPIGTKYKLEPSGFEFKIPVTVSLNYSYLLSQGFNSDQMGIVHRWDSFCEVVPSENDKDNTELEFDLLHFSVVGILYFYNLTPWTLQNWYWDIPKIKYFIEFADYSESYLTKTNVRKALDMWESHTSSFIFEFTDNISNANIILIEGKSPEDFGGSIKCCENHDAFILLNSNVGICCPPCTSILTTLKLKENDKMQIVIFSKKFVNNEEATQAIAHEVGHAIGIDHPRKKIPVGDKVIMAPFMNGANSLHPWDIEALHYHYDPESSTETGPFTDPRDGITYETVKIGTQVWMSKNLAYLPSVSPASLGSSTSPYYYVYDYNGSSVSEAKTTSNYISYGVLYNWTAATIGCPVGWHLPSNAEWSTLYSYVGSTHAEKLKALTGWSGSPTNSTGFSALPGGERLTDGVFSYKDIIGIWYRSNEIGIDYTGGTQISNTGNDIGESYGSKSAGYSVRCIKD